MTYLTEDYVGVHWLRRLPGLEDTEVANEVKEPWAEITDPDGNVFWKPNWPGTTFISIVKIADADDPDAYEFSPIYEISVWARPKNKGSQPPWFVANQLAKIIERYPKDFMETSDRFTLPGSYGGVRVSQAWVVSSAIRGPDNDPNGLARYTLDFALVFNPED